MDYNAKGCRQLEMKLSNDKGDEIIMTIDPAKQEMSMNRPQSGPKKFSRRFEALTIAPLHNTKAAGQLRIFIDRCSIEIFDGEGKFAMTNLVFPTAPYSKFTVSADGGRAKINSVNIYPLNPSK